MDFYLQLLKEQYDFMESQYEQRINQPQAEEEKQTCPCGLVWMDECSGCEEGESANWEQLELTMNS
jgi:hypothetical protein